MVLFATRDSILSVHVNIVHPDQLASTDLGSIFFVRVKSGKFGHQVNSDTHLKTMRRLLTSRLIRIFTVCLVNFIFIPIFEI